MAAVQFTKETFQQQVLNGKGTALIDFWATWCVPCKMQGPIVDQLAEEAGDVIIGKVNVDDEQDLAADFGIMSIPTILIFRDGKEIHRMNGLQSKQALLDMLK